MEEKKYQAPSNITLDEKAMEKLANSISESKIVTIREILKNKDEIIGLNFESIQKLARIAEATIAHGSCGIIGCF